MDLLDLYIYSHTPAVCTVEAAPAGRAVATSSPESEAAMMPTTLARKSGRPAPSVLRTRGPTGKEGRSEVERDGARKTAGDGAGGLRQPKPAKDAPPRVSFRRANSPARWLPRACASSS